jgi:glycosyltransferase involved in cell wall biosynthesis
MKVDMLAPGFDRTVGLSRYADSLVPELRAYCDVTLRRPTLPPLTRRVLARFGDAETFFSTFPVTHGDYDGDVCHLSTQTLAIPLLYDRSTPTVVTVHDIFPYVLPKVGFQRGYPWYEQGAYRVALRGLRRADHLVVNSVATKRSLIEWLDVPEGKISVVYLGIDRETFRPQRVPDEVFDRHGLDPTGKHVLYVGSEQPRKAVHELVDAFAEVAAEHDDAVLVKAGTAQDLSGRTRTLRAVREHGLEDRVAFTGHVAEDDLVALYNLADLFASASYYEGFGFPFVEAMACGTPVLGRDRSAMREVIPEAAYRYRTREELSAKMIELLSKEQPRYELADDRFRWEETARRTARILETVAAGGGDSSRTDDRDREALP